VQDDLNEETGATGAGQTNGSGPASVEAAVGSEAAAPAEASAASPPPRSNVDKPAFVRASAGGDRDAIDLGTTVLPDLLKSYAPHLASAAVGFVVGVLVARARRR
jgi:uncharacterized protein